MLFMKRSDYAMVKYTMRHEVCQGVIFVHERSEVFGEQRGNYDARDTLWETNAWPLYNVIFNAIALATAWARLLTFNLRRIF